MAMVQRSSVFLDHAILRGRVQQLRYAFRNNDDFHEVRTSDGLSPLVLALRIPDDNIRQNMFNFLLVRGADVSAEDTQNKRHVLAWACHLGRADQIKKLLDYAPGEFDFRQPDTHGLLPLHHAVRSGNPFVVFYVVREMAKYSVPVDVPNSEGLTPFLEAKRLGYELIAQILIKEGNANPTQFDTKTFRTKSRWAEAGHTEREEAEFRTLLNEIRITGSCRPHTSYEKRRELNARSRLTLYASSTTLSACPNVHTKTSHIGDTHKGKAAATQGKELYSDLQILDLHDVVDRKTNVEEIRRNRVNDTESESSSDQNGSNSSSDKSSRRALGNQTWSKLNNLMSLSDKSAVVTTDAFARSVGSEHTKTETHRPESQKVHGNNNVMITSMMTSLSQQMSTAFRKTVIPKPCPIVRDFQRAPKKKKGSTLAFIMKTMSNGRRVPRRVPQARRSSVSFKTTPSMAPTLPNPASQSSQAQQLIKSRTYTSMARVSQSGGGINRVSRAIMTSKQSNPLPRIIIQ